MAFSSMVKDINRKIILESFWDFSRNTKQDITKKTELSFPTVSKLVDELNEQDIIHMLSDKRGETGGRKANEYILNQEYAYSLCLKVEREYIEVFIVDLYKQNISYDKIEEKSISAEKILKVIETKILNNKIKSIVVGIPGFIHDGIIGMADGIEALNGCNLKTEIYLLTLLTFPYFQGFPPLKILYMYPFPLFLPLWDNYKGKFIIQLFNHCLLLYQEFLRKSALLPL